MINRIEPPSLSLFRANRNVENKNIANKREEDDRDFTTLKPNDTVEVK